MNIDDYVNRRFDGEDYATFRREMKDEGYAKTEISSFISEIDEQYLLASAQKRAKNPVAILDNSLRLIIGGGLFLFGFVLLVLAIINQGAGLFEIVLIVGSLGVGSWFFSLGRKGLAKAAEKKIQLKKSQEDILD